ncbi:class I SAM-dependent methyltransferase [Flavisphingomonas formosensis]|uniref:class I SAM-dependent methyltransferase n=1 Tax=Flavisphingomonas formosensis TaxID=861534 RepID=UPI0012FCDD70|nr:rRNA adenine N-6-methyltransferase family protein [Sphingomonas formosensis]
MAVLSDTRRADAWQFFRTWLKAPLRVAAYGPSSPALARAVAAAARPGRDGLVIELGVGTGALTEALVEAGVSPERLVLLESDEGFADLLRRRYPRARVIGGNAYGVVDIPDLRGAASIVSGLPLVQVPAGPRAKFVLDCLARLGRPGARFVQLTYMLSSPVPLPLLPGTAAEVSPTVWANFPPARVWSYSLEHGASVS